MSGSVWNVLENIRNRNRITALKDHTPATSKQAVISGGKHEQ